MEIKILGSGCANCKKLEKNARDAVESKGIEATFSKVTEMTDIMAYGVMSTPALVIDEEVKSYGRVLSSKDIQKLL